METKLNRRDFAQISTFLTAALGGAGTLPGQKTSAPAAGHITSTAIADDCLRLAMCSDTIPEKFKSALARDSDLNRIGGLLKLATSQVPALLDSCRERLRADKAARTAQQEMVLIAGWLCQKAAVRHIQPGDDVHRDVLVMRELSQDKPPGAENAADLLRLFEVIQNRRLIALHTLKPDAGDVDAWLARLVQWRRESQTLLKRYAEAYGAQQAMPDFYNRANRVIQLARAVQRGTLAVRSELKPALDAARSESQYARAIAQGYGHLEAASLYLDRKIDSGALLARLGG